MNFLVTNDDGILAPGVKMLVHVLRSYGKVYVICPDRERSATGHAITFRTAMRPIPVEKVFADDVTAWSLNGTPADCVKLGVEILLEDEPDFVFSGMNAGANVGKDIYCSGTVAGAVEASFHGLPATAVSVSGLTGEIDYSSAGNRFSEILNHIFEFEKTPGEFLNVNLPNVPAQQYRGVKKVPLDLKTTRFHYVEGNEPGSYWLKGDMPPVKRLQPGRDLSALLEGWTTLTSFSLNMYRATRIQRTYADWSEASVSFDRNVSIQN